MSVAANASLALLLWGASPAGAPPSTGTAADTSGWWLPDASTQLEMEATLIPVGKGAIFVPAMTDPSREPPYQVLSGNKVVARSPTGKRTALDPGHYRVLVGSGVQSQMTGHEVEVEDGHCTLVEADWGGLVIRVVDAHGMQFRGSYEVFSLTTGEHFGLGIGADESRGEGLRTWLLPAGQYLIVRPGESARPRTNFLTLRLTPGENVAFTVVQQVEDGGFLGGGAVGWGEGHTTFRNWRLGLLVGGDFMWNRLDHPVGKESGYALSFNGFVDWVMRYLHPRHFIYFRTQLNEGQSSQFNESLLKSVDEFQIDVSYTFRLLPWFGPYVRAGLDTNLFPGEARIEEPYREIVILDHDGLELERKAYAKRLRLSDSFDPLVLKEGCGLSFDVNPGLIGDLQWRVGFGARQQWVRSLLREAAPDQETAVDCTEAHCFERLQTSHLVGVESTLLGSLRLGRWLMLDTELDGLVPMLSEDTDLPIINWKNTLSLRLSSFASLSYVVRMDYDTRLSSSVQTEQRVLLRFAFNIL